MTRPEFDEWLDHHVSHFPGVGTWLNNMGDRKVAVLKVWFNHLAGSDFDACSKATTALYVLGDAAPVYERHPQAIRTIVHAAEMTPLGDSGELRKWWADRMAELEEYPWTPISEEIRKVLFSTKR